MSAMDKAGASKGTAGYMQTRTGRRPIRVDTLVNKEMPSTAPWSETPQEESKAPQEFESGLAEAVGGDEFSQSKEAALVAQIAGASESGKTTVLNRIADENPDVVVKDQDEFIEEARQNLGLTTPRKSYSPAQRRAEEAERQEIEQKFLVRHKDDRVVMAGFPTSKPVTDTALLLKTGPKTSTTLSLRRLGFRPVTQDQAVEIVTDKLKVAEAAPGIPDRGKVHSIPTVKPTDDNVEWDASMSMHPAKKRGDHIDLRLVDPKGRAHSWALPAELPVAGKSSYAVRQPTHTAEYAMRDKPFELPEGYGQTREGEKVQPIYVGKVEVVQAGNKKVRFLRHLGKKTEEYVLRKIDAPGGKEMWAFHNATKNRRTKEGKLIPDFKPKYKNGTPDKIDVTDPDVAISAKIDGAHTVTALHGPDRPVRVYSYRAPRADPTDVIDHTYKMPDYQKRTTPKSLKGTVLRTELWFSKDGKAIPVQQIAGLLNSGTVKSRRKQKEMGVEPRLSVIDVVRHKGKDVSDAPYDEKLQIMQEAADKVDGLELPPMAFTPEEKAKLVKDVGSKKLPHTSEGVVAHHRTKRGVPFQKGVFRPDHDVYVRDVFVEKEGKTEGGRGMAGGFLYSVTPDGPVVGKVGTGFDHKTKKDMMDNPEDYIGRVATVRSMSERQNQQDPDKIKALRAPSFQQWHLDKNDPEMMKEAKAPVIAEIPGTPIKVHDIDPHKPFRVTRREKVRRVLGRLKRVGKAAQNFDPAEAVKQTAAVAPDISGRARSVTGLAERHGIKIAAAKTLSRKAAEEKLGATEEEIEKGKRELAVIGTLGALAAPLYLTQDALGKALGFKRVYHGTTDEAKKNILREGLLTSYSGTGESSHPRLSDYPGASAEKLKDIAKEQARAAEGKVFITPHGSEARSYAKHVAKELGESGKKGVVKMTLPRSMYRALPSDPTYGIANAFIDTARISSEDIPTKYMSGTGLKNLGERWKEIAKGLPSHAKHYPEEVLGGAGRLLFGAGLLTGGVLGARHLIKTRKDRGPSKEKQKAAGAGKDYGPGGKWIHDRAHHIMEKNPEMNKGQAYAISTQQAHAVKKSPKGFRTAEGVRSARRKYDDPKHMKKSAASAEAVVRDPKRIQAAEEATKRGAVINSLLTGVAASSPVKTPTERISKAMLEAASEKAKMSWPETMSDDQAIALVQHFNRGL